MDMTREPVADALLARLERDGMHSSADTLAALIRAAIAHLRQPAPTAQGELPPLPALPKPYDWMEGNFTEGQMQSYARAAIATAQAAAGVPPGYVLVPVEPTEAMHNAAVRAIQKCTGNDDFPPAVYSAMLNAAPSAPAQSDSDARDAARLDFITEFGTAWSVQWEQRPGKPVRYRMIDDGEPWGKWHPTPREAIDAAIAASAAKGEQQNG